MKHVISYVSTASLNLDYQSILNILFAAQTNNNANGIRGILVFSSGKFFQVIQGKKEDIQSLFNDRIKNDSRHRDVTIIIDCESRDESHDFYFVDYVKLGFSIDPLRAQMYYDYLKTLDPHINESISKTLNQIIPNPGISM